MFENLPSSVGGISSVLLASLSATSILVSVLLGFVAFLAYQYAGPPLWKKVKVFQDMGVPYMSPLKARMELESSFLLGKETFIDMEQRQVETYGKLFGKVDFGRSMLIICEPDLLRDVFVKEFSHFYNRREALGGSSKLFERSLFFERNQRWREIRALVTPTFSSAKMRAIDGLIRPCLDILQTELDRRAAASDNNVVEIDGKQYFSNFAMDVIGTVFFGVGVDAINNREHPFVKHSFAVVDPPAVWRLLLFCLVGLPLATRDYFENIIPQMVNERRKTPPSQQRRDFLSALINAREKAKGDLALTASGTLDSEDSVVVQVNAGKRENLNRANTPLLPGSLPSPDAVMHGKTNSDFGTTQDAKMSIAALNDEEIAGQCFTFMMAGFETTATTIGFLLHELAMNQECQTRLREEIKKVVGSSEKAQLSYDSVANMRFLDACINETLRLHPPLSRLERECMEDCTLSNGLQIKKGLIIGIPTWYIQRSSDNFADPEKFDPDRFYDAERRAQIKPYTYLPFGQGPRNCVGQRFALLELKMMLAFVVQKYRIVPTEKTVHPVRLEARTGEMLRPDGIIVGLQKNGEN